MGCVEGSCTHPKSPRTRHFRISCSTVGVDSTFMTKKEIIVAVSGTTTVIEGDDGLDTGVIVALIALGVGVLLTCSFLIFLIRREKSGKPMFSKLIDQKASP